MKGFTIFISELAKQVQQDSRSEACVAPSGADKITSDKRSGRESIRVTVSISLDTLNVDRNDILLKRMEV